MTITKRVRTDIHPLSWIRTNGLRVQGIKTRASDSAATQTWFVACLVGDHLLLGDFRPYGNL
jgi:hypothetical protein